MALTQPERVAELVRNFPVPRIKEKIAWVSQPVPNVRREDVVDGMLFVDLVQPYPILRRGKPCNGKVFTVKMLHHRGDQACAVDTLGLKIKGLDKNNMSQPGDVMVSMTG